MHMYKKDETIQTVTTEKLLHPRTIKPLAKPQTNKQTN